MAKHKAAMWEIPVHSLASPITRITESAIDIFTATEVVETPLFCALKPIITKREMNNVPQAIAIGRVCRINGPFTVDLNNKKPQIKAVK
jgi:hypothetical protein